MERVKRLILLAVPMTVCNLKCSYCYLSHRGDHAVGKQIEYAYSPEQVGYALRQERLGGICSFNVCADGETLLVRDIVRYLYAIAEQGHYLEIVTNMTATAIIDEILSWDKTLLSHIEFKCSFHYLELKKHGLLERFAANIRHAWEAGASANIEITPCDELIPCLDEVKAFSMRHFGALPHLSIARDDHTPAHALLTKLAPQEYNDIWSTFHSDMWKFKMQIFGIERKEFCYAGAWTLYTRLDDGMTSGCYSLSPTQNIFERPDEPISFVPVCCCSDSHCYNGHIFVTWGCIPSLKILVDGRELTYADIRDRVRIDGTHWLRPELRAFYSTKLFENNKTMTSQQEARQIHTVERNKVKNEMLRWGVCKKTVETLEMGISFS